MRTSSSPLVNNVKYVIKPIPLYKHIFIYDSRTATEAQWYATTTGRFVLASPQGTTRRPDSEQKQKPVRTPKRKNNFLHVACPFLRHV